MRECRFYDLEGAMIAIHPIPEDKDEWCIRYETLGNRLRQFEARPLPVALKWVERRYIRHPRLHDCFIQVPE